MAKTCAWRACYPLIYTHLLVFSVISGGLVHAQDLPPGKAWDIIDNTCSSCHGVSRIVQSSKSHDEWKATVDQMIYNGAQITPEDAKIVVDYLAKYLGPDVNVNTASAKELQTELDLTEDEAAAIVQARKDQGNFKAFVDLQKVKGLDTKKLEPLKGRIVFN